MSAVYGDLRLHGVTHVRLGKIRQLKSGDDNPFYTREISVTFDNGSSVLFTLVADEQASLVTE